MRSGRRKTLAATLAATLGAIVLVCTMAGCTAFIDPVATSYLESAQTPSPMPVPTIEEEIPAATEPAQTLPPVTTPDPTPTAALYEPSETLAPYADAAPPVTEAGSASQPSDATGIPSQSPGLEALILEGNTRYYTDADLAGKSAYELSLLRNGLYALSGKQFVVNPQVIEYFSGLSWYHPDTTDDDIVRGRFNDYQSANLALILQYEGRQ